MARTALTVQSIRRSGLTPAFTSANAQGHSIENSGREYVEVVNGSGASINVTVQTPGEVDGQAIADRVVAVGAGARAKLGPWPVDVYNQPGTSDVYVDFSAVTTVTVGAFRL